ncbi:MAG TPA: RNA pseudouridine synthase [bacterium]|nr:RNA pseudouridine synthase [bacterium]HQB76545.1 RNA pseudouridine synthase [bacterium]
MKTIHSHAGDIQIIYESGDFLVINKPAGLIVHKAAGNKSKALIDYILESYPEIKKVGEDKSRPGIVHRLDKDASGLMIIARNNQAFVAIKQQFKKRTIYKEYLALVHGQIIKDEGKIIFPLTRSKSGHKMAALPASNRAKKKLSNRDEGNIRARLKAKKALSLFTVEKKWPHFSLVSVNIKTGRTHQIRAHFAAYGHALVGDDLYGTNKNKLKNKKMSLGRIFLVAKKLKFKDREGNTQEFQIDLPSDLKKIIDTLKK